MSAGALFLGLLIVLWLALSTAGWLIATLRFRPNANWLAWGAALLAGTAGAVLPALLGWKTLAGFLTGLLLALLCSTAAAWQTMLRITRHNTTRPQDRVHPKEPE